MADRIEGRAHTMGSCMDPGYDPPSTSLRPPELRRERETAEPEGCPCCTGVDHEPGDPDLCALCADRCGQRCCHRPDPTPPHTTTQAAADTIHAAIEVAIGHALGHPVRLTGMRRHPNGTLQLTLRPPPRQRALKGCPSEAAYRRHPAAGEPTDVCGCREHMRQVEAQRRARHPEWWSSINRSTRATGGAR